MTLAAAACLLLSLNAGAGQGGVAVSSLSATSFTFSAEPVGTPGASQTLTLTNTGGAVLNIVTIAIVGPDFGQSNTCGNTVAAGASCAIDIVFDPIAFGTRTGSMTITSNATNSPQTVTLQGSGMGPAVSLSTTALNFASQLVTTTSAPQTVVLKSAGDEPLTVSTISVTGPFNVNDDCLSAEIAAGQACTLNIYFTPLAGGSATGTITINDNAFPTQQAIALSGTGADFAISLSPTSNTAAAGASANYSISVIPAGGFSGTIALGCGGLKSGISCTFAPGSVTVSGSTAATSALTVSTTAASQIPPGAIAKPFGGVAPRSSWFWALLLVGLVPAVFRKRKELKLASVAAVILLFGALAMPACGNSKSTSTGTTLGTYSLVVTGTTPAGSQNVQRTAAFTLVVN